MSRARIRALFVDIGGVLATNGWDAALRRSAAAHFHLDAAELDSRHRLLFELYETGKMSWRDYLSRVVFYRPRPFSADDFTAFVLERSRPFPEMIELVKRLKHRYGLKVVAVSNEGRELTQYRISRFGLQSFVDAFVISCFVRLRKPDLEIFRLALDVAQVEPANVIYLEDRDLFVEIAGLLGIPGIIHRTPEQTRTALAAMGLADRVAA